MSNASGRVGIWAVVTIAAAFAVLSLAVSAYMYFCPTCGDEPEFEPIAELSDASNATLARLHTLREARRLSPGDVELAATAALESEHELVARRFAIAFIGDFLRNEQQLSPAGRARLERVLLEALDDKNSHVRSSAMAVTSVAGLLNDDRFRSKLREIRDHDPDVALAQRAARMLEAPAEREAGEEDATG